MKSIMFDFQHNTQIFNTISGEQGINRFPWNVGFRLVGAILLYGKSCNFDLTQNV